MQKSLLLAVSSEHFLQCVIITKLLMMEGRKGTDSLLTPLIDSKDAGVVSPAARSHSHNQGYDGTELEVFVKDDDQVRTHTSYTFLTCSISRYILN